MSMVSLVVFISSAVVVLYVYFGYPALIYLLATLRPRPVRRGEVTPHVSVIIPVFNEESMIVEKIENTLALDYPADRLETLIVSDGSTDGTEALVRSRESNRVRLLSLPRGGKAAALNAGANAAVGEVLVFTDANVSLERGSLRQLVTAFADPEVGAVSGRKKHFVRTGTDTTEQGENLYWRWDQWQKELESTFGSMFAADGAFYAVRKELYVPIGDPAQADDIAISTRVVLQGHRLVLDRSAIAWEEAPAEGSDELRRKIRVTNHSVRALLNLGPALWTSGFYSVELLSHKLIRHLVPFFLVLLFLASARLAASHPFFDGVVMLQLAFYALALAGAALRGKRIGKSKLLTVPYYFCLVNLAALLGVASIARGTRLAEWSPRGT